MAQNVVINGVTYQNVPEVDIPKSGSGTAKFYDTSGADAAAGDILSGKSAGDDVAVRVRSRGSNYYGYVGTLTIKQTS